MKHRRYAILAAVGLSVGSFTSAAALAQTEDGAEAISLPYKVRLDVPKQVIKGLGVEIQSDSIGSDNDGLPEKNVSVPHDLTAGERLRLARDLIGRGHGFRYIR